MPANSEQKQLAKISAISVKPLRQICECGRPAVRKHCSSWICARCYSFEQKGIGGGPNNERVGIKHRPRIHALAMVGNT